MSVIVKLEIRQGKAWFATPRNVLSKLLTTLIDEGAYMDITIAQRFAEAGWKLVGVVNAPPGEPHEKELWFTK